MTLLEFYKAYIMWVNTGVNLYGIFDKRYGLCYAASKFSAITKNSPKEGCLSTELTHDLLEYAGTSSLPFGNTDVYRKECRLEISHLNLNRVSFVESRIAGLSKVNGTFYVIKNYELKETFFSKIYNFFRGLL